MGTGNYSATSNNMKLVHWPPMGGLLHLIQQGADWAGPQPAQAPPRCTKCNSPPISGQYTNHCIAVQWTIALRFNGPLKVKRHLKHSTSPIPSSKTTSLPHVHPAYQLPTPQILSMADTLRTIHCYLNIYIHRSGKQEKGTSWSVQDWHSISPR